MITILRWLGSAQGTLAPNSRAMSATLRIWDRSTNRWREIMMSSVRRWNGKREWPNHSNSQRWARRSPSYHHFTRKVRFRMVSRPSTRVSSIQMIGKRRLWSSQIVSLISRNSTWLQPKISEVSINLLAKSLIPTMRSWKGTWKSKREAWFALSRTQMVSLSMSLLRPCMFQALTVPGGPMDSSPTCSNKTSLSLIGPTRQEELLEPSLSKGTSPKRSGSTTRKTWTASTRLSQSAISIAARISNASPKDKRSREDSVRLWSCQPGPGP